MIIQRRADQLEPGDILPDPRRVITCVASLPGVTSTIVVFTVSLEPGPEPQRAPPFAPPQAESFQQHQTVNVEVRDFTPVQVHAEELVALARLSVQHSLTGPVKNAALAVLAKIDPPAPPTLEELAGALAGAAKYLNLNVDRLDADDRAAADQAEADATAMLKRARAAGLLK